MAPRRTITAAVAVAILAVVFFMMQAFKACNGGGAGVITARWSRCSTDNTKLVLENEALVAKMKQMEKERQSLQEEVRVDEMQIDRQTLVFRLLEELQQKYDALQQQHEALLLETCADPGAQLETCADRVRDQQAQIRDLQAQVRDLKDR